MANAREIPLVVQGNHYWFAAGKDAFQVLEREESLIDPVQMYDISLPELVHRGDVGTSIGNIHLENTILAQAIGEPNDTTFPQELGFEFP